MEICPNRLPTILKLSVYHHIVFRRTPFSPSILHTLLCPSSSHPFNHLFSSFPLNFVSHFINQGMSSESKGDGSTALKVVLRVRPLFGQELLNENKNIVEYHSDCQLGIGANKKRLFTFDHVFPEDSQYVIYPSIILFSFPPPMPTHSLNLYPLP